MEELNDPDILQGITDAFAALAIAMSKQIDPHQFSTDLRTLAAEADRNGETTSASLIGLIAAAVDKRAIHN